MNVGRFRHKIDVQQELTTQNTYGEPTQTWVTFLSGMYCSIEPIRGKEYLSSDIIQAEVSHRIKMRYIPGVHPKQRILYCGRYFYIIDAIDIVEQHKMLECMCKELV